MLNTHDDIPYDFELERVVEELKKLNARKVLIQLPNGLRKYAYIIFEKLRKSGFRVFISTSHTYGGCDVAEDEAKLLNVDIIVHFGHLKYYEPKIITLFIPAYSKLKINTITLDKLSSYLKDKSIKSVALSAVVQHLPLLNHVKTYLDRKGIECRIIPTGKYTRVQGQVLGCSYEGAVKIRDEVDCFIVIAGGMFHGLGLGLATNKTTIILDPYEQTFKDVTERIQRILRVRYWKMSEAKVKQNYVLIIGSKPGQYRPALVELTAKKLERKGKNIYYAVANELNCDVLRNMDCKLYEVYVVTSCPRLPIDDLSRFEKPVLTPGEALMIADDAYDEYIFPW